MAESEYRLDWVTENIAVGCAPLSYAQLDQIREQGIDAIVNLCGEYCDLHDIEMGHGFEVYYLPIPDECTPDREDLEKAMDWMDSVLKGGRRLLIHCRLGMGRTGTLLYAYLWSRNLHPRLKPDLLEQIRARPCNYQQWRLAERYRSPHDPTNGNSTQRTVPVKFWQFLLDRLKRLLCRST